MCHDGLRIYGEELGETRDCITTDFRRGVFDELNPLGDEVVEGPASLNFDIKLAGKVFAGSGEDDEGALWAIEMSNAQGSMRAVTTYLLNDRVVRVKCADEKLEGFWPGSGLEGAKESDENLLGGVAEHHRRVCECLEGACLDIGGGLGAGLEDQPRIVFEDVASDGANLVTLLGHRGEDVGEVAYVVWHTLILVQSLQTTRSSTSAFHSKTRPTTSTNGLNQAHRRQVGRTTVISRWIVLSWILVESRSVCTIWARPAGSGAHVSIRTSSRRSDACYLPPER
jgi:hypothetical protein